MKLPAPQEPAGSSSRKLEARILLTALLSMIFFLLGRYILTHRPGVEDGRMIEASRLMEKAQLVLRECRLGRGLEINGVYDPNRTGLIGEPYSTLTTTIGTLEAKRTTTNPNFAALLVHLLQEAGVGPGDTIAVGASGSFPALILALLSAAQVMEVNPILICSLGSSTWGANHPRFTWLDMHGCLGGIFSYPLAAVSLGGESDLGRELAAASRAELIRQVQEAGIRLLDSADLQHNVRQRMAIYTNRALDSPIAAFVNIGGSWANLGRSAEILKLNPGLNHLEEIPAAAKRGVIFEMGRRGIPVIHLLHIKGLALGYGLPWDPVPLPPIGRGEIYQRARRYREAFWILTLIYLALLVYLLKGPARRPAHS